MGTGHKLNKNDYINKVFGRLKVLDVIYKYSEKQKRNYAYFVCECQCNNKPIVEIKASRIKDGVTSSCGCYRRELAYKHGLRESDLYDVWCDIKSRCETESHARYNDYGGRGIKFCNCISDCVIFYNWCYDNGYEKGLTVDRIDNDGHYCICKNNLRITDYIQQGRNRRVRKDSGTGHIGVMFVKRAQKYIASIGVDYKKIFLGSFTDINEAIAARKAGELTYWG